MYKNGKPNGAPKRLDDEIFFSRIEPGHPELGTIGPAMSRLRYYLGAQSHNSDDAITAIRSFFSVVRGHVENGATVVVVSSLGLLETCLPEPETKENLTAFVAELPRRERLTAEDRASIKEGARQYSWVTARLRQVCLPEALDCRLLLRQRPPAAADLIELYEQFVGARDLLLETAALYAAKPEGWERPYRELNLTDYLNVRLIMSHAPSGVRGEVDEAGDEEDPDPEVGSGGAAPEPPDEIE